MAHEIGVVLVEANFGPEQLAQMLRARHEDALPCPILSEQFLKRAAFGGAIFRVGMVIVKARAIPEHKVALNFNEA